MRHEAVSNLWRTLCTVFPILICTVNLPLTRSFPPQFPALVMSQTSTTAAASSQPSSRFLAIFQAARESYEKQTKQNLLVHPLASQLQSCDSTTAILAILHDQVREFDKSCSGDEKLTKWLGPTVNVLNAFSATISGGVSLVSLDFRTYASFDRSSDIYFVGIFASKRHIHRNWRFHFSKYPIIFLADRSHAGGLIDGAECFSE
jgi:hypothetical protein